MGKLNGFLLLMVLMSLSGTHSTTTTLPFEDSTANVKEEVTENTNEAGTTKHDSSKTTSNPITTETAPDATTEAQTEKAKPVENLVCSAPSVRADASNCHIYYECSVTGFADKSLRLATKSCSEREAFSSELGRCSREISSCEPPVQCVSKGAIADPASNTSYYLCQSRFSGTGFYVFRVQCGRNKIFRPKSGLCVLDLKELINNGLTGAPLISDFMTVRKEIRELQNKYKQEMKKKSDQQKAEEKIKAKAEAIAKKQLKLLKEAHELEASSYKCETEGNFPSALDEAFYIACMNNGNKVVAIALECSIGRKFNPQTGTCETAN